MFERSPVRVVLDAQLRVPLSTSVVATVRETPTWIFASRKASPVAEEILQQKGCKVFRVDDSGGRLDIRHVLRTLADQGITRLMVEGGPIVAGSFVEADLVDEAVLFRGAKSIGTTGIAPLEKMPLEALTGRLASRGAEELGLDKIESFVRA
jgi:diaminohydroxyphosphoribosylaminopyrimidine deaminase/5-amino-6-(5-phosphoribosylamino)uracil reductase